MKKSSDACYVVAVSGGVDSVVLLDMLRKQNDRPLVVAHVDHGMRPESHEDAAFVRELAATYNIPFEQTTLQLGSQASEATARQARYEFLRKIAKKHNGTIVVAHHGDDVVETVALHLQRGTGWRGLAVFGAIDVYRPLTTYFKDELIAYASRHRLAWREDSTNTDTRYARNKLRPKVAALSKPTKLEILALWRDQQQKTAAIDVEVRKLITQQRYFYTMAPPSVAREVMRATLLEKGIARTRPQLDDIVLACKVTQPGGEVSLGKGAVMRVSKREFSVVSD